MKLTDRQRKALEFLRDDEEYGDMVYEPGAGWWLGICKTNGKLALNLIRLCLISREQYSYSNRYERWTINEAGRRVLNGQLAYRKSDGTYTDKMFDKIGDR